jgi:hypothetical protein
MKSRGHRMSNEIKVRRLEFQIVEFETQIKDCVDEMILARFKKSIDARKEAILFLKESRKHVAWPVIEEKFGFRPYLDSHYKK